MRTYRRLRVPRGRAGLTALASLFLITHVDCLPPRAVDLVSRALDGGYANSHCYLPDMTPDGRWIVFESTASNLVPDDTNGKRDVFLYDTRTRALSRVSMGEGGEQGNGHSYFASISDDGRYVAYITEATNLAEDDGNGKDDIVVRDTWTGENRMASRNSAADAADDHSSGPALGAAGRHVAFVSVASNLVPGDTNYNPAGWFNDVFVKDFDTGAVERVSLAHDGAEANGSMSKPIDMTPDGRFVLFRSKATNLVPGDTNGKRDLFLRDRVAGTIERVNVGPDGQEDRMGVSGWNTPHVTPDGRYVTFASDDWMLDPDPAECWSKSVYVRDRQTGTTERVEVYESPANHGCVSDNPAISADGQYVVFESVADEIVPDDRLDYRNIFRFDRVTGEYIMVDRDLDGTQFQTSLDPSVSWDGKTVAFESWGPMGTTAYSQIYVAIGLP